MAGYKPDEARGFLALIIVRNRGYYNNCGGSIINDRYGSIFYIKIVTERHSFYFSNIGSYKKLVFVDKMLSAVYKL